MQLEGFGYYLFWGSFKRQSFYAVAEIFNSAFFGRDWWQIYLLDTLAHLTIQPSFTSYATVVKTDG